MIMKTIKALLICAMAFAVVSSATASLVSEEGHAPYYTTLEEGLKVANENKSPLLIKFFTDWCKWCVTIDTVVMIDPVAIKYFSDEMVLVKINAEVDTLIAQKYHVSGYPTSVMLGIDGEEVDRIIGYAPTEEFLGTLSDYQNGVGTLGDMLKRVESEIDRELYLEIADKYKYRGGSEEAVMWFEKVITTGKPLDSLSGVARLSHANMLYRAKNYDKSMAMHESIKNDFGPNYFGETADIWCAIIFKKTGDTKSAVAAFKKFKEDYPKSEDFDYATEQIDKLSPAKEASINE